MRCVSVLLNAAMLTLLLCAWVVAASPSSSAPPFALTIPCVVSDITDGDTLTVTVSYKVRVRLLDVWAPEMRGGSADSRHAAQLSKQHLEKIAENQPATLYVPLTGARHVGELFSMERLLGRVWVYDSDLSEAQIKAGHGTLTKAARDKRWGGGE